MRDFGFNSLIIRYLVAWRKLPGLIEACFFKKLWLCDGDPFFWLFNSCVRPLFLWLIPYLIITISHLQKILVRMWPTRQGGLWCDCSRVSYSSLLSWALGCFALRSFPTWASAAFPIRMRSLHRFLICLFFLFVIGWVSSENSFVEPILPHNTNLRLCAYHFVIIPHKARSKELSYARAIARVAP